MKIKSTKCGYIHEMNKITWERGYSRNTNNIHEMLVKRLEIIS